MGDQRNFRTVIREAELLASPPERVSLWLQQHNRWSADEPVDDLLEFSLLKREERLIDLALARHGSSRVVLKDLFERNDEVLRVSVFSNENVHGYVDILGSLAPFTSEDDLKWISDLSEVELDALFSNPKFPPFQIIEFFEMRGAWEFLNQSQRQRAGICLIQSMIKWTDTFSIDDPETWESIRLDAAASVWAFAEHAEIELTWAYWLGSLYRQLGIPSSVKNFDPLHAARRWCDPEGDGHSTEDNKGEYLSAYQEVRCGLARLAVELQRGDKDFIRALFSNEDVAIRCGVYRAADLSPEEIDAASTRDGRLACLQLIENQHMWRSQQSRDALEFACLDWFAPDHSDETWYLPARHPFIEKIRLVQETHPQWFKFHRTGYNLAEKPLVESSIGDLSQHLSKDPKFADVERTLRAQNNTSNQRFNFLLLFIFLAAVLLN
jgi:hypothetical protein